ncbi:hypothetical protein BSKO_13856 [Bryopsis sp. KO-2023]|nr:hypothetical protein BSKO_13856 [Bryopsis sp. KO-2023]
MALYASANNFFLSEDELVNTPSRKAGIDEETEYRTILRACDFVVHGLGLLRCPQQVLCTAQVFIHRFFCKCSVDAHETKHVVMAAAWLATKIEEAGVRLKDLIPVFQRVDAKRAGKKSPALDPTSDDFFKVKQKLVMVEKEVLKSFRFLLHTAHPHRFLLTYLHKLELESLMQLAWNIVNDSFRTPLCVRFKCEVIACGAIFMAARKTKKPLPANPPWYKLFGASKKELYEVCRVMLDLYSRPPEDFCPSPPKPETPLPMEASPHITTGGCEEVLSLQSHSTHNEPAKSKDQMEITSDANKIRSPTSGLEAPSANTTGKTSRNINENPGSQKKDQPFADSGTPPPPEASRKRDRNWGSHRESDAHMEERRTAKKHKRDRDRGGRDRERERDRRSSRSPSRDRERRREKSSREHRRSARRDSVYRKQKSSKHR